MRVALLCNIDQSVYHVGDEAIFAASVAQLRIRGIDVVPVSRGEKYGPGGHSPVEAVRALEFPWIPEDRQRYLSEIRAVLAGDLGALPADDKVFQIIEQLATVDALVIGGGGALNSRFGWLLYERMATALIVAGQGKPVILSGQSIGPDLSMSDREVLAELLDLCLLVGVRDADSYRIVKQIRPDHPAVFQTIDDAVLLDVAWTLPKANRIGVVIGSHAEPFPEEDYVDVMSSLIDGLAERTGAEIEFIPHMADPDSGGLDERIHRKIAEGLSRSVSTSTIELCTQSAQRLAECQWVATTRFHPAVFGLLAGACVLPIGLDRYGLSRMDGALRSWGWHDATLPFAALWDPVSGGASEFLPEALDALVGKADDERDWLESVRATRLEAAVKWWDQVAAALTDRPRLPDVVEPVRTGPRFSAELQSKLALFGLTAPSSAKPATAIVMRTRDRPELLDRAVQDVLAQTSSDWQLVVVNDAGERSSVDRVLARYTHDLGSRLSIIHNPVSRGMEAASNLGVANSVGDFVVIHDDDDCWQPCFLQQTAAYLQAHPDDQAVTVRTDVVLEKRVGQDYVEYQRFPYWGDLRGARLIDFMKVNRMVPISVCYRRSVHDLVGPYDEQLPVVGDYEFYLRLLQHCRVGYLDRSLAEWRQRPVSTGAAGNSMFTQSDAHRTYDMALRDQFLHEWTDRNGIGLPMFIAKTVEQGVSELGSQLTSTMTGLDHVAARVDRVLERLDQIEQQIRETDHAVRNGGGFNYAKRKAVALRDALGQMAHRVRK